MLNLFRRVIGVLIFYSALLTTSDAATFTGTNYGTFNLSDSYTDFRFEVVAGVTNISLTVPTPLPLSGQTVVKVNRTQSLETAPPEFVGISNSFGSVILLEETQITPGAWFIRVATSPRSEATFSLTIETNAGTPSRTIEMPSHQKVESRMTGLVPALGSEYFAVYIPGETNLLGWSVWLEVTNLEVIVSTPLAVSGTNNLPSQPWASRGPMNRFRWNLGQGADIPITLNVKSGPHYLRVNNPTTQALAYAVLSRGIGDGYGIPVTSLAFTGGVVQLRITNDGPVRSSRYYKVEIPNGVSAWTWERTTVSGTGAVAASQGVLPSDRSTENPMVDDDFGVAGGFRSKRPFVNYTCLPKQNDYEPSTRGRLARGPWYLAVTGESALHGLTLRNIGPPRNLGAFDASFEEIVVRNSIVNGEIQTFRLQVPAGAAGFEASLVTASGAPTMHVQQDFQIIDGPPRRPPHNVEWGRPSTGVTYSTQAAWAGVRTILVSSPDAAESSYVLRLRRTMAGPATGLPYVAITNFYPSGDILQNSTVTLSGFSGDPDGTIAGGAVLLNGVLVTNLVPEANGDFRQAVSANKLGTNVLQVRIVDNAGLMSTSAPVRFVVHDSLGMHQGFIRRDVYTAASSSPLYSDLLATFESSALNYPATSQRLSGYFTPESSGNFRFYISSSQASELWFRTNGGPSAFQKIAADVEGNGAGQWLIGTNQAGRGTPPTNQVVLQLEAGKTYEIFASSQVQPGADYLGVTWETEGGSSVSNGTAAASGSLFSAGMPGLESRGTNMPGGFSDFVIPVSEGATNLSLSVGGTTETFSYLYLRKGSAASQTNYDFHSAIPGGRNILNLESPECEPGNYFVRIITPTNSARHSFVLTLRTNFVGARSAEYPISKPLDSDLAGTTAGTNWFYFRFEVPANDPDLLGWALNRVYTGGGRFMVRRDLLPINTEPTSNFGNTVDITNGPSVYSPYTQSDIWPSGEQISARTAAMGNPLEPGIYFLGVTDSSSSSPWQFRSRQIGFDKPVPVRTLSFDGGAYATNTGWNPTNRWTPASTQIVEEYFHVRIPTNARSWRLFLERPYGTALCIQKDALPSVGLQVGSVIGAPGFRGGHTTDGPSNACFTLFPSEGNEFLVAGDYFICVSEGSLHTLETYSLTSHGEVVPENLGYAGPSKTLDLRANYGEVKTYQFEVLPGTGLISLRLTNETKDVWLSLGSGTRFPRPGGVPQGWEGGDPPMVQGARELFVTNPPAGVYTLIANAGLAGTGWTGWSARLEVSATGQNPGSLHPAIRLNYPSANTYHLANALRVSGTAEDLDGAITLISVLVDGVSVASVVPSNGQFSLLISNVVTGARSISVQATDDTGNISTTTSRLVQVVSSQGVSTGFLQREVYRNLAGSSLGDFVNDARYRVTPDYSDLVTSFESAGIAGTNEGVRLFGYIKPPTTGNYLFYISAAGQSALWFGTNAGGSNVALLANDPGGNGLREWVQGANQAARGNPPVNISQPVAMTAGQRYWIEAAVNSGSSGDALSVTWIEVGNSVTNDLPSLSGAALEVGEVPPATDNSVPSMGTWTKLILFLSMLLIGSCQLKCSGAFHPLSTALFAMCSSLGSALAFGAVVFALVVFAQGGVMPADLAGSFLTGWLGAALRLVFKQSVPSRQTP